MIIATEKEDRLGAAVVDCAYAVHHELGPGLLEPTYELCFCHELKKRQIPFRRQIKVPLVYDGLTFPHGLRLDVLVDDLVICELKSVEWMAPVYLAQILSQLRLSGKNLGYLINFNVDLIKHGIRRVIR